MLSLLAFMVAATLAAPPIRRKFWEVFYYGHLLLIPFGLVSA
jgi:hypothetical protein